MASFFVSNERVPVYLEEDPQNIIYIRPKMTVGIKNRVQDAIASITGATGTPDVTYHLGAYNLALMTHNVLGWSGPAFEGMQCTPENMANLDPDLPLLDKVMSEINRRNTKAEGAPDPKPSSAPGKGVSKPKAAEAVIEQASGTTT